MTIRTKYVNGMNEIRVDHSLKQAIINNCVTRASTSQNTKQVIHSRFVRVVISCIILFLLAIGGRLIFQNGESNNPTALFSGFVVTVYAADGASFVVEPDVDFPLGQYSLLMSSVPGFPITIASKNADMIKVQSSEGQLILWNPADSKVIHLGEQAAVRSNDTIYWSPLVEGDQSRSVATSGILQITAYKGDTKLGSSTIEITLNEQGKYKGKLSN
ncbi:hypothetical protein [Paenibacillus gorillae]|uniref:hypothetical protein n=1 Tax=Paenibacillus gorillae TaxID=1243662 RepID=UPI0005A662C4|nr:hypothetical protein [Paenibacillus gorillae]